MKMLGSIEYVNTELEWFIDMCILDQIHKLLVGR